MGPPMKSLQRSRPARSRAGLTSVELAVSMVVLLVALGGVLSSISSSVLVGESARETSRAYLEAHRRHGWRTDALYLGRALKNIFWRRARSH